MNFHFYAIIDPNNGGICSIKHDEYESLKAIFNSRKEAEAAILKKPGSGLFIKQINIIDTDRSKP